MGTLRAAEVLARFECVGKQILVKGRAARYTQPIQPRSAP
jgi:hypothetical protein